jgi:DNA repair exonuclease SbcCD ATPase subunit
MSNKVVDTLVRDTLGKFVPKSEVPRKVRSVNLTDDAWQWLATVAEKAGMSRNDYLEALAEGNSPFMEMVEPQAQPLMETANTKREIDEVNIEKQPETELYPFIETVLTEVESVKLELEAARAENQLLQLGNSSVEAETLNQELASLREQLEAERASRQKIEAELSELKQNFAPAARLEEKLAPDAATILSQFRAKRKKSSVSLADIEAILEIIEKS